MFLTVSDLRHFWSIVHHQGVKDKYPTAPVAMVATDYRDFLLALPQASKQKSRLIAQIKILKDLGVFKSQNLSDDVIDEILVDLAQAGIRHITLIKGHLKENEQKLDLPVKEEFIKILQGEYIPSIASKIPHLKTSNAPSFLPHDWNVRGNNYFSQGEFKEAIGCYLIGFHDFQISKETSALEEEYFIVVNNNLGLAYFGNKDFLAALKHFKLAIQAQEKIKQVSDKNKQRLIISHEGLFDVYYAMAKNLKNLTELSIEPATMAFYKAMRRALKAAIAQFSQLTLKNPENAKHLLVRVNVLSEFFGKNLSYDQQQELYSAGLYLATFILTPSDEDRQQIIKCNRGLLKLLEHALLGSDETDLRNPDRKLQQKLLRKIIDLKEAMQVKSDLSDFALDYRQLGDSYRKEGDFVNANNNYQKSQVILKAKNPKSPQDYANLTKLDTCFKALGKAVLKTGDKFVQEEKMSLAIAVYKYAWDIKLQETFTPGKQIEYLRIANKLKNIYLAQKDVNKLLDICNKGLNYAWHQKGEFFSDEMRRKIAGLYKAMAVAHKLQGNTERLFAMKAEELAILKGILVMRPVEEGRVAKLSAELGRNSPLESKMEVPAESTTVRFKGKTAYRKLASRVPTLNRYSPLMFRAQVSEAVAETKTAASEAKSFISIACPF